MTASPHISNQQQGLAAVEGFAANLCKKHGVTISSNSLYVERSNPALEAGQCGIPHPNATFIEANADILDHLPKRLYICFKLPPPCEKERESLKRRIAITTSINYFKINNLLRENHLPDLQHLFFSVRQHDRLYINIAPLLAMPEPQHAIQFFTAQYNRRQFLNALLNSTAGDVMSAAIAGDGARRACNGTWTGIVGGMAEAAIGAGMHGIRCHQARIHQNDAPKHTRQKALDNFHRMLESRYTGHHH